MATTELRVFLLGRLDRVRARYLGIGLAVYVDDIAADAAGPAARVQQVLGGAGDMLCQGLISLRLAMSEGKCKCVATSDTLAVAIATRLTAYSVVAARWAKALGVATAAGARRCVTTQTARLRTFRGRLARYARIARARLAAARLLRTGGLAVMTYGDGATGVSSSALHARRLAAAAAFSSVTKGRDVDIALILGEVDPAFAAHAEPIGQWAEAVWDAWTPRAVLQRTLTAARRKLARASRPWAVVAGPASAAVATAA